MKNVVLSLLIILLINNTYSQSNSLVVKLSGKIENPNYKAIAIQNSNGFKKVINLLEDGSFSDTLSIHKKGMFSFSDGRESTSIYLDKNYNLTITLDTKQFDETINYSGVGAENNNFLAKKYLITEKEVGDGYDFYGSDEKEFLEKQKLVNEKYSTLLNQLKDKDFVGYQLKEIIYNSFLAISSYKTYHRYITKDNTFEVSKDFLNPLLELKFNDEKDYENFKSYSRLVNAHYMKNINNPQKIPETIKNICSIESSIIKNGVLNEIINSKLNASNENVTLLYNEFIKNCKDKKYTDLFTSTYNKIKKILKGQPSPKFSFNDINNKLVNLDDFKGKYVYIDVWATWCSPCMGEIPYLKKLEEKYHEKNIVFVSISVDNKKAYDKWKQVVENKQLKGQQLFADKSWNSDFVKSYQIKGIPTFILVDPEGNIVSASAMRPSNPELKVLFDSLLK